MKGFEMLKLKRKEKKLTQKEVADTLGISVSMLSHIESGRRNAPAWLGEKLEAMFDIPMNDIVGKVTERGNEEDKTLSVTTSGGKRGGSSVFRVNIPTRWIRDMGLSEEKTDLTLVYDEKEKEILIKKRSS